MRAVRVDPSLFVGKISTAEHDLLFNSSTRHFKMKHMSLAVWLILATAFSTAAQAPDLKDETAQVLVLAKDVQTQQSQIIANQTKIDSKLAELAEAIRMARIFSSRGR